MAKEVKEKVPGIIPLNEYVPAIESQVDYYMSKIPVQVKNKIKYSHTEQPIFKPNEFKDFQEFQIREIDRCKNGWNGMCGKLYFFYNYCYIRDITRGKILPDYRKIASDWFEFVEDHLKPEDKRGIVSIKRRRIGASVMAASDILHSSIFNENHTTGMNSKSEASSRELFRHVKFMYQNLPEWLRPRATSTDRRDFMEFAYYVKDAHGNRIKKGIQSWILTVAPVPENHEGNMYTRYVGDEGGKTANLLDIWALTQDCLMKPPKMAGLAMIFGTVGNIGKEGAGLKELWEKSDEYRFDKFFLGGYNALDGFVDEYGNDLTHEAVRSILYERERLKSIKREYEAHKQKYPLDDRDAFNQMSSGGVGNIIFINDQITKLTYNPPLVRTGWMRPKPDGGVDFVPSESGKVKIYDLPDPRRIDGYLGAADPADHDDVKKNKDVSDLALVIGAKPFGMEPPKLVASIVDRPEKLDSFFVQSALLLKWYGNAKALIEDNRARMVNYFKQNYPHLLPLVPKSIATAHGGFEMRNSIKMTEERKQQGMGLMEDYIDNYCQFIPSINLLEQHKVLGDPHAADDEAVAWMLFLIFLQSSKKAVRTTDQIAKNVSPHYENRGGRIVLVADNKLITPNRIIPRSPLFK